MLFEKLNLDWRGFITQFCSIPPMQHVHTLVYFYVDGYLFHKALVLI